MKIDTAVKITIPLNASIMMERIVGLTGFLLFLIFILGYPYNYPQILSPFSTNPEQS